MHPVKGKISKEDIRDPAADRKNRLFMCSMDDDELADSALREKLTAEVASHRRYLPTRLGTRTSLNLTKLMRVKMLADAGLNESASTLARRV